MKNTPVRRVRNRTSGLNAPESRDRRVRRTKHALHHALLNLAREKPYDAIAVKEILDRADVGRSTFYTHFEHKDDLLESGIHEMLRSMNRQRPDDAVERILGFSRPFLEHIAEHRHDGARMPRKSRRVMHQHLEAIVANLIAAEIDGLRTRNSAGQMPPELIARHIASTFVLVLNWWLECEPALTPAQVDTRFRSLVQPSLVTA